MKVSAPYDLRVIMLAFQVFGDEIDGRLGLTKERTHVVARPSGTLMRRKAN